MHLVIDSRGTIHSLYDETLDLRPLGQAVITRASHIEPDIEGRWWAEIVNGPRLGPFERRSTALQAELEWLEAEGVRASSARNCGQTTRG